MALQLIIGSMYSGKSTELIQQIKRLKSIGMRCLVVNHSNDTRLDGGYIQTHDGDKLPATKTNDIMMVRTKDYDAIAIDEGQFFSNLRTAVVLMLQHQKHVIVAGLSGDYERKKFGSILDLIPIADNVLFKRALCAHCNHPGKLASFTKRMDESKTLISVNSTYAAVCRQCYEDN